MRRMRRCSSRGSLERASGEISLMMNGETLSFEGKRREGLEREDVEGRPKPTTLCELLHLDHLSLYAFAK